MNKKPYNIGCCSVSQCGEKAVVRGYCDKHYRRWKAHGDPKVKLRADRGAGCLDKSGYVRVPNPRGGQTFQHRLVMEAKLGRALLPHENVHHKNGIRSDNRPANLELWTTSQPTGQRVQDKIAWAKSFLKQYGYKITH